MDKYKNIWGFMVAQQCHVNTHSKLCTTTFGLTVQFEYGFEM